MPMRRPLTRPADGKCAACGAELPEECKRGSLSYGTDVCQRCAVNRRSLATGTPEAKAWLEGHKQRLFDLERDNLE